MRRLSAIVAVLLPFAATAPTQEQQPQSAPPVPIHTAPDDLGTPYGIWAAADSYKASFHGDMTFVPYLGDEYPHNQPWSWRTTSVRIGGTELLDHRAAPARVQRDYRYEYHFGALTEAYDVLPAGLEQTFVVHQRPAAGDLVITGAVTTSLRAPAAAPAHQALVFADGHGEAIVRYGEAFAFDAEGDRIDVRTAFEDGVLRLTVPGEWLATASMPVTVDPLLARVLIANAVQGYSVREVDIARDDIANDVLLVYVRSASQYDDDVFARVANDDFTGQSEIYADVTSSWDSDDASCAWVGGAARWVVVFRRYFAGSAIRQSQIRCHVHASGNSTLQTNVGYLTTAAGVNHWRPAVGGTANLNVGTTALVVCQTEHNTNTAGHWANVADSRISGSLLDVTSANGTFGQEFHVYASSSLDCERPAVTKVVDNGTGGFSWVVAWQYCLNTNPNDAWDVLARRVGDTGAPSLDVWRSDHFNLGANHSFGPVVEGANGHYAVAFTTTDVATTPYQTGGVTGKQLWIEPFEWAHGAASPSTSGDKPPVLIASTAGNQLVAKGLGFDLNDNSHWTLSYSDIGSSGRALHYVRVGYNGAPTETGTLYSTLPTGPSPYGGGCVYNGDGRDFLFGYGFAESVCGQTLEYVQPPPRGTFGYTCSPAIIDWSGTQQIGAQWSRVTISGAPTGAGHFLLVSLGPADLPIVHPAVQSGCRLLVDSGGGFLGTMPFLSGTARWWYFPLPEWLPPLTLHFQDFMLDAGSITSSRRLSVPVVR